MGHEKDSILTNNEDKMKCHIMWYLTGSKYQKKNFIFLFKYTFIFMEIIFFFKFFHFFDSCMFQTYGCQK